MISEKPRPTHILKGETMCVRCQFEMWVGCAREPVGCAFEVVWCLNTPPTPFDDWHQTHIQRASNAHRLPHYKCAFDASWMCVWCAILEKWSPLVSACLMCVGCELDASWMWVGCELDVSRMWVGCELDASWMWVGCALDVSWVNSKLGPNWRKHTSETPFWMCVWTSFHNKTRSSNWFKRISDSEQTHIRCREGERREGESGRTKALIKTFERGPLPGAAKSC